MSASEADAAHCSTSLMIGLWEVTSRSMESRHRAGLHNVRLVDTSLEYSDTPVSAFMRFSPGIVIHRKNHRQYESIVRFHRMCMTRCGKSRCHAHCRDEPVRQCFWGRWVEPQPQSRASSMKSYGKSRTQARSLLSSPESRGIRPTIITHKYIYIYISAHMYPRAGRVLLHIIDDFYNA